MTFLCTTVHIYCTAPSNLLVIYFTWRCSFFYSDCNMCTACSNIFTAWCFINSDCAVGLSPSLSISPHHAATKKNYCSFLPNSEFIVLHIAISNQIEKLMATGRIFSLCCLNCPYTIYWSSICSVVVKKRSAQ